MNVDVSPKSEHYFDIKFVSFTFRLVYWTSQWTLTRLFLGACLGKLTRFWRCPNSDLTHLLSLCPVSNRGRHHPKNNHRPVLRPLHRQWLLYPIYKPSHSNPCRTSTTQHPRSFDSFSNSTSKVLFSSNNSKCNSRNIRPPCSNLHR